MNLILAVNPDIDTIGLLYDLSQDASTQDVYKRQRQALGLVIAVLVLIGVLTVLHAGVNAVAKLFDDTAQKLSLIHI